MIEAYLPGFLAGSLAYLLLSGFQELRLWRLSLAVKRLQEQMLTEVRRDAANKRWKGEQIDWTDPAMLKKLEDSLKNGSGQANDTVPDKWGGFLSR